MRGYQHWRPVAVIIGLIALVGLSGCLGPAPASSKHGRPGDRLGAQGPPSQSKSSQASEALPKAAYSTGLLVILHERTPNGKILPFLRIHAASGTVRSTSGTGTLFNAHTIIYKAGQPIATVAAPWVEFSNEQREVYAKGGVTVHSLKKPTTILNADRVTWYGKKNIIVAEGNVHAVQMRKNQPTWVLQDVQHLTVDTDFNQFQVP